ncbi:hypothetical protein ACN9MN_02745 [Chryseobacterium sp. S-02]|uniref:hypothetical protein n=1 Tax=Chryseobacterium sp. S-02 TaxID=3404064 RepID=UPI003CF851F8
MIQKDIFTELLNGETILLGHPQMSRLREEAYKTKELLIQMNNSSSPEEISGLFGKILDKKVENVAVFTPIYINYGKNISIGKMFLSILTALFLHWAELPLKTTF